MRSKKVAGNERRISKKMHAAVIAQYGDSCWLAFPGCTGKGTSTDHVLPWACGGPTVLWNLRRACEHCNYARGARVISGIGATIHAVIGPPAGGKTSYVAAHKKDGDIVIDFDQIALTILTGWPKEHDTPDFVRNITVRMWSAAYRAVTCLNQPVDVWLIKSLPVTRKSPRLLDEWVQLNYDVVVCDPGKQVVSERLKAQGRNAQAMRAMQQWYSMGITVGEVARKCERRRVQLERFGVLTASTGSGGGLVGRPSW